jgi:protein TonB
LSTAFYRTPTGQERPTVRRRALSLALAVAIEVLLLLAFLTIDLRTRKSRSSRAAAIAIFDLGKEQEADSSKASSAPPTRAIKEVKHPKLPPVKPTISQRPLELLEVSKDFLDAADISKLGSNAPGGGQLAEGGAPGDSEMVGTAPNGEPLYAAEWYREPTNRELATYLPRMMPDGGGWGMIACRTIERFHVDDCVELGQGPSGSHLAGAVRQAAWQFLVRPPRVGGKAWSANGCGSGSTIMSARSGPNRSRAMVFGQFAAIIRHNPISSPRHIWLDPPPQSPGNANERPEQESRPRRRRPGASQEIRQARQGERQARQG